MASIINATVTSPGGLVTTGDNTNELKIQTGETDAVTVNSSQVVAFNNPIVVAGNNISADNSLGFRNRIINGDMRIDQRNAGASGTAVAYTVDRWGFNASLDTKGTWQQNAGSVTPPAGFINYLGFTSNSAYSVPAGELFTFQQRIEGTNVADLGWGTANAKTITISFWVRSSLTGTFGGALRNSAANRSYPFTYSISSADTWEYKTITIAGDTSGTWLSTNGIGITVIFSLGTGSTFSGTAGAWAASNLTSATGATSVVGTNGATFYITGVQLEVGSVATPFERRDYGRELALCMRYFEVGSIVIQGDLVIAGNFSVPKRAIPTMVRTGNFYASASAGSVITPAIGSVGGISYYSESGGNGFSGGTWTASAEL